MEEATLKSITTHLVKQFNLPEEQVTAMVPSFIAALLSHMQTLETALEKDDLTLLARAAHTIKGAFLNLGLLECAEIAMQIEQKGKAEDGSADFSRMVKELKQLTSSIFTLEA